MVISKGIQVQKYAEYFSGTSVVFTKHPKVQDKRNNVCMLHTCILSPSMKNRAFWGARSSELHDMTQVYGVR